MATTEPLVHEDRPTESVAHLDGDVEDRIVMVPHRVMQPAQDELPRSVNWSFVETTSALRQPGREIVQ